jgi:hypothetical protein
MGGALVLVGVAGTRIACARVLVALHLVCNGLFFILARILILGIRCNRVVPSADVLLILGIRFA